MTDTPELASGKYKSHKLREGAYKEAIQVGPSGHWGKQNTNVTKKDFSILQALLADF